MNKSIYYYVQKFLNGSISKKELLKEISFFILKIPVIKGYYDDDIKYDFYAYVISKIEKIILNYKIKKESSFESWFFVVLSRQFYNYLNKKLKPSNYNFNIQTLFPSLSDLYENYYSEKKIENDTDIHYDFSFLTEKERNILAFKYGINAYNNGYMETAKIILEKIEKKKKIEEKIYNKYLKLLVVQKEIIRTNSETDMIILKNKETMLKKYKRRLEKIFKSYNIYPSNEWVANKLGISEGTVGAYLFKIKNKIIKRYFTEFNYYTI
ncbi:MAG: hypothetical protein JXB50_07520 [Spirochaetes bacterium]|nr:hypothetical protein [Spirochaetota bacterium]